MFDLTAPWWEIPARAFVIYTVLLLLVRMSGKRTVGQFTPFDLLVVMLLSESVSNGLSGDEHSLTGALLGATTLVALNVAVAFMTARSHFAQGLVEGRPVLIGRHGKVFTEVLKRNHVPMADVERSLREADCDFNEANAIFLEADGQISVLKESNGGASPKDEATDS